MLSLLCRLLRLLLLLFRCSRSLCLHCWCVGGCIGVIVLLLLLLLRLMMMMMVVERSITAVVAAAVVVAAAAVAVAVAM